MSQVGVSPLLKDWEYEPIYASRRSTLPTYLTNHWDRRLDRQTRSLAVMPVEVALGLSARNPLMKFANRLLAGITRLLPGLFGYQTVFLARPASIKPAQSQRSMAVQY